MLSNGQQSQSPFDINGGSVLAMAGKDCVAIAVDKRFGVGPQLINSSAKRILKVHGRLLVGVGGFDSDVQTLLEEVASDMTLLRLRSRRPIAPAPFASYLSDFLWKRRLFVTPVVAGLNADGTPFLCMQDSLGAPVESEDFVVCGTSTDALYGVCEAIYRDGMDVKELFEAASHCLMAAMERDCFGGYGATIHLITKDGIESHDIICRND